MKRDLTLIDNKGRIVNTIHEHNIYGVIVANYKGLQKWNEYANKYPYNWSDIITTPGVYVFDSYRGHWTKITNHDLWSQIINTTVDIEEQTTKICLGCKFDRGGNCVVYGECPEENKHIIIDKKTVDQLQDIH